MLTLIDKRTHNLLGQDPTFLIELSMLQMLSGAAATERVQELVREIFPTRDRCSTLEKAESDFKALQVDAGFLLLPTPAQSTISFAIKLMTCIRAGATHTLKMAHVSAFWTEMWRRVVFCCLRVHG